MTKTCYKLPDNSYTNTKCLKACFIKFKIKNKNV